MNAAHRIMEDAIASHPHHVSVSGTSRQLGASTGLSKTAQRLPTWQHINQASNDASGLDFINKLGADIRIAKQRKRNTDDSLSYMQVVNSVINEVIRLLTRAANLAAQGKADTISNSNFPHIDAEFQKIISTIHDIVEKTAFNGAPVFTSTAVSVAVGEFPAIGLPVSTPGSSTDFALGLSAPTHTLTTPDAAATAGLAISTAIDSANSLRASLSASLQQLTSDSNFLGIQVENFTATYHQNQDADLTEEVVNLTKFQLLSQSGTHALNQANQASQRILQLLWKLQSGRSESQGGGRKVVPSGC